MPLPNQKVSYDSTESDSDNGSSESDNDNGSSECDTDDGGDSECSNSSCLEAVGPAILRPELEVPLYPGANVTVAGQLPQCALRHTLTFSELIKHIPPGSQASTVSVYKLHRTL